MRELYDLIFSLPPRSFTLVAILFGFILIDDLTAAEQNALGNFIILIGQVLETNSAQQQLVQNRSSNINQKNINDEIVRLRQEIEKLKNK